MMNMRQNHLHQSTARSAMRSRRAASQTAGFSGRKRRGVGVKQAHAVPPEVGVRVIRNRAEFDGLEAKWNLLHVAARGTIFQTYTWNREWWRQYERNGYHLHIATVWCAGRLVGVLPLFLDTLDLKFTRISRLRFLGTHETYGEYTPLVHPFFEEEAVRALTTFCADALTRDPCTMLSFSRFPSDSSFMQELLRRLRSKGFNVHHIPHRIARVMMQLPRSWEEYLRLLSVNERTLLRRRMRSLDKRGVQLEVVKNDPLNGSDFDDFVRLHRASWNEEGFPGYFASLSRFEPFHRAVASSLAKIDRARLYFLSKDGERFAAVLSYIVNDIGCFYLSGMDRNHELRRYSPGRVLLAMVIRDCVSEGFAQFDFQGGRETYKLQLGGKETFFSEAIVWRPGPESIKVFLFSGLQRAHWFFVGQVWNNVVEHYMRKLVRRVSKRLKTGYSYALPHREQGMEALISAQAGGRSDARTEDRGRHLAGT